MSQHARVPVNVLSMTVAAGLLLSTPLGAQDLDEVTVTARKREESVLKVPVVETVISADKLEKFQITDLTDLSTKVTGLSMGGAVLAIGPQISLRGVGTTTLDAGVDQSVSLNIDGLSLSQGLAFKSGLFDLAQVEVLKGPQALFFGKNSPGGVIALRTADPGREIELVGRAGYESEARERRGELIFSAPVSDTLGIRLAGMVSDSDGFFRNKGEALPGTGAIDPEPKRMSATRSHIVRGTLLWAPTNAFDARLKLNWTQDDVDGDAGMGQMKSCPDGTGPAPGFPAFLHPDEDCRLDRTLYVVHMDPEAFPGIRNGGRVFLDLRQEFGTLEMNYRPREHITLTSVTGYYRADTDTLINGTQSGYAASALVADNDFYRKDFSQELRFDTDFPGALNGTLGVYYQNGEIFNLVTLLGNTALGLPPLLQRGSHLIDIESVSAFGQLRWRPSPKWEISGGVRWTDEERTDTAVDLASGTPVPTPLAEPRIASDNYSPEFTVTYLPGDDLTVFGSFKRGYKSGSFTITTPALPNANNAFGDEKAKGGEIGMKSRWLDRALAVNLAGYYYIYEGLQVGSNQPAENGVYITRTINAGEAKVYGVELEASYRLRSLSDVTLNTALNWNRARYTKLRNVPCWGGQSIAEGCDALMNVNTGLFTAQDSLDGLQMVRAPEWQAMLGFTHEMDLGPETRLVWGVDGQYISRYPTALSDRRDVIQDGYVTFDANMTLTGRNGGWEVALVGSNLTNEIAATTCTLLGMQNSVIMGGLVTGGTARGPAGIDEVACGAVRRGRELWLKLTFRPLGLR